MNEDTHQLTEAFAAHEHLAPDASDVLARAHAIARSYQRRRLAVRATGGAVLGASLVAGSVTLPGLLGHTAPSDRVTSLQAAGGDPSPSPGTTPVAYNEEQELNAYFAAGYDYDDAVQLAQIWKDGSGVEAVKAEAGLKLLQGQTLPVAPSGTPESAADQDLNAFFAAGYDYDDAVTLSGMWHEPNVSRVKAEAGHDLLDGQSLPIPPSGSPSSTSVRGSHPKAVFLSRLAAEKLLVTKLQAGKDADKTGGGDPIPSRDDAALQAFSSAGYDYGNAVTLAKMWHDSDIVQAKADAGRKLLDGQTLPIAPSGSPETHTEKAENAFITAGYDYDDAVTLGKMWHVSDISQVKADAGQKLLDGQKLPIAP